MILGLVAGRWLRAAAPSMPMKRLVAGGAIGMPPGWLLHFAGICPVVKRIWTPAWTLFSGGACLLLLAAFCWVIDVKRYRKWAFPLIVIGMNSIAAYMIAHLFRPLLCGLLPHPPRAQFFQNVRRAPRTAPAGRGGAAGLLADTFLDVPAQALPAHLSGHNVVPGCAAATPTEEP